MHIQRVMLLPPAAIGLLAVFLASNSVLAWTAPSIDDSVSAEPASWQYLAEFACMASFLLAMVAALTGNRSRRVGILNRVAVFTLACFPLAYAALHVLFYSSWFDGIFGPRTWRAVVHWPAAATWLTLAAAIVLLADTLIVGWFGAERAAKEAQS